MQGRESIVLFIQTTRFTMVERCAAGSSNQSATARIWHDPLTLTILGLIGTIAGAIIGVAAAYLIFRRQIAKEVISYQVISNAQIVNLNSLKQIAVKNEINRQSVKITRVK